MGERERGAPEGCSPNLLAFLSNTPQFFAELKPAPLLCLNLWCFMAVCEGENEKERARKEVNQRRE